MVSPQELRSRGKLGATAQKLAAYQHASWLPDNTHARLRAQCLSKLPACPRSRLPTQPNRQLTRTLSCALNAFPSCLPA
eukprot:989257-Pelagomonas_calceolata.AAC.3